MLGALSRCSAILLFTVLRTVLGAGVCGATGDSSLSTSCKRPAQGGIALLQRKQTLTAVEAGDGEAAANASRQGQGLTNSSVAGGAPCVGSGCSNISKANNTEVLMSVNRTESNKTVDNQTETSEKVSTNETIPIRHEPHGNLSAWSLSAAGGADGVSGSVNALREPGMHIENETSPPISQERIEPFGYPGAGLLLELHLPKVTLRELHTSSRGSLAQFLLEVREELGKGAKVQESRLSILGIHGRYKRYDSEGYFRMKSDRTDHMANSQHLEEEVVVRFEILPGWSSDVDPRSAMNVLKEQLSDSDSSMMKGPLATILLNSTVTLSSPVGMASNHGRMTEHRGMAHMSAMAWPIGISAAFIGVLIWLAAY